MPKKILLIDRDGTINKKAPKGEYITSWDNFEFIPETFDAMKLLAEEGYKFIVITNQAGIARGKITSSDLESLHQKMLEKFKEDKIDILKIYYSPHHWEENSFMRKPQPGMFFLASTEFDIRLDKIIYIGDDLRDCQAAYNAGCKSIFLGRPQEIKSLSAEEMPIGSFNSLLNALDLIRDFCTIKDN
jgi:D-glycero-D-manno-heptose 1,7-bisphosphate phosphatase